jgi:hypothetical protein
MNNTQTRKIAIFATLVALMAATREYHFGTALHLPDASLAVFLLAGFYLPRWAFPVLLLEAGLVDYLALNYGGVDGWCFSPAYWFLIPTYFVLWFAGRFYAERYRAEHCRPPLRRLTEFAAIAFSATGAAFLISNASFYLLADYFGNMSAVEFGSRVEQYFLPYLQSAFLYLVPAAVLHFAAEQVTRGSAQT